MNKDELNKLRYDLLIEKSIKKSYLNVIINPTGFVRGITTELSNDIRTIKSCELPNKPNIEKVNRIKYICDYSLSKMSDRRKKRDSNPNSFSIDNFTEYQDALKWAESHLKDS